VFVSVGATPPGHLNEEGHWTMAVVVPLPGYSITRVKEQETPEVDGTPISITDCTPEEAQVQLCILLPSARFMTTPPPEELLKESGL
jgi:hypothetical protein